MKKILAIQHTYATVQVGLFENNTLIGHTEIDKKKASGGLILLIDALLKKYTWSLHNLSFIAVNQGPGPFTTLRVVIATVNGLSFATRIPLIGIDGLKALTEEYKKSNYPYTISLLNAYSQDVYFAVQTPTSKLLQTGYKNITVLLTELKQDYPNKCIRFIGNGTQIHNEQIVATFGSHAIIPEVIPEHCSIQQIGSIGNTLFEQTKDYHYKLLPLYLKNKLIKKLVTSSNF
jgi:tRNA threonylcarbamoyladenosine biosynthesis protein TsaB